jgi:hypothetical protein
MGPSHITARILLHLMLVTVTTLKSTTIIIITISVSFCEQIISYI